MIGYWMFGPGNPVPLAREAERLGAQALVQLPRTGGGYSSGRSE